MAEDLFAEDFGQRVDLTQRIREVLTNYPEGTTILKELIQNADDARATKVSFCLDRRHHGSESLAYAPLAQFQGPSLLVHNNAVFTEDDFESISRVGDSRKRAQAWKTGRFGIGFNSVYHLSDLPSFVSTRYIVFFDPHCKFLPRANASNPGKRIDFVASRALETSKDQFTPYRAFGCDMERPFEGTLFRLPLRTPQQAQHSKLSRQAYTADDMAALLTTFQAEAVSTLLFLKTVETVEILEWLPGEEAPGRVFCCSLDVTQDPRGLMHHRQAYTRYTKDFIAGAAPEDLPDVYSVDFVCERFGVRSGAPGEGQGKEDRGKGAAPVERRRESFLVSQRMGGGSGPAGRIVPVAKKEYDLHLLPWVSLAARTAVTVETSADASSSARGGSALVGAPEPALKGQAFCFLPLPVWPGLPLHVNGYFELSSNRRDIWSGDDMDRAGRLRSNWNKSLLQDVAAPAYALLLLEAAARLGPTPAYYSLLPSGAFSDPWLRLVQRLYESLLNAPVLYSPGPAEVGGARGEKEGHTEAAGGAAAAVVRGKAGRWVSPRQALFHDEECEDPVALERALVRDGMPVVRLPGTALRGSLFQWCVGDPRVVVPHLVREHLRAPGVHPALAQREDVLTLLQYCLGDVLDDESADTVAGLRLLPLANGTLGMFLALCQEGQEIVVPAKGERGALESRLLCGPGVPKGAPVVDREALSAHGLLERLQNMASAKQGNVCLLDAHLLSRLLSLLLPRDWQGQREVPWGPEQEGFPTGDWVRLLWQYVAYQGLELGPLGAWPLLPTNQGALCRPLLHRSAVLVGRGLPEAVTALLVRLGCRTVWDGVSAEVAKIPKGYVLPASAMGVLDTLANAAAAKGAPVEALFAPVLKGIPGGASSGGEEAPVDGDADALRQLRAFLCETQWYAGEAMRSQQRITVFRSLPIFELHSAPWQRDTLGTPSPGPGVQGEGGAARPAFVSLQGPRALFLPPAGVDESLLGEQFVRPGSEREAEVLAHALGVPQLPRPTFFKMQVVARLQQLPPTLRNDAMLGILKELPQLQAADPSMRDVLSSLEFVPAALDTPADIPSDETSPGAPSASPAERSGAPAASAGSEAREGVGTPGAGRRFVLRRPCELYDPRNEELRNLLGSSEWFPAEGFAAPEVLDMLQGLGLRTAVTRATVIESARAVERLVPTDPARARERGQALLSYLELNGGRWAYGRGGGGGGEGGGGDPRVRFGRMLNKVSNLFQSSEAQDAEQARLRSFWADLTSIAWCPVLTAPPELPIVLPWPGGGIPGAGGQGRGQEDLSPVAPPRLVRPRTDMWLVSASMRVLDGECRSSLLGEMLGWAAPLSGSILAAQLLELGRSEFMQRTLERLRRIGGAPQWEGKGGAGDSDGLEREREQEQEREHMAAAQALTTVVPRIYGMMTDLLGSDEMEVVKAILEGTRWVWVGDTFCSVSECAFSGPLHLAPYLRLVPADLAAFRPLLAALGVREALSATEYVRLLSRMARDASDKPLPASLLAAAVWLVQHLADQHFEASAAGTGGRGIHVPDVSGILAPAADLVYNDAPWLPHSQPSSPGSPTAAPVPGQAAVGVPGGIPGGGGDGHSGVGGGSVANGPRFVHAKISNDVADKLGVKSLRRLMLLESGADSLALGLHEQSSSLASLGAAGGGGQGVEAFGQHEALTTRLKHIVEMYAEGPGILCELVQNADDAGATEVAFVLDYSEFPSSSLLSPRMADWQGPALYAFNNAVFSQRDLFAISRIGQDSKLEKPSAIGRFGLGFNSVYHFTDVPAFVSGQNLVIFDPHATNLPGITPSHPGLKIGFVGRRLLDQFPDQFKPFLLFGCNLQDPFPATLFRFPLRRGAAAPRSEIKQDEYTPAHVLSLFEAFKPTAAEALLFLRNVSKVSVFTRDSPDSPLELMFSAQRSAPGVHPHGMGMGATSLGGMPLDLGGGLALMDDPNPQRAIYEFVRGDPRNPTDKEQFFRKLQRTPEATLPWQCGRVSVTLTGPGAHMASADWLISSALGGGRARDWAVALEHRARGFLPWAGVAALLLDTPEDLQAGGPTALGATLLPASGSGVGAAGNGASPQEPSASENRAGGQGQGGVQVGGTPPVHQFTGKAFCFLPLPVKTGLPVHVNGYFELSSNRRDIWYGDDMSGGGKLRSEWNKCLLDCAAAPAYARMLARAAQELGPTQEFFSLWPVKDGVELLEPWAGLATAVLGSTVTLDLPVLHTGAGGGRWLSPKRAVFPDWEFDRMPELAKVLMDAGLPLVDCPRAVAQKFLTSCPGLRFLTPSLLRKTLKGSTRPLGGTRNVLLVLSYCLSDMAHREFAPDQLFGLPLLPLANGFLGSFGPYAGRNDSLILATGHELTLFRSSLLHRLVTVKQDSAEGDEETSERGGPPAATQAPAASDGGSAASQGQGPPTHGDTSGSPAQPVAAEGNGAQAGVGGSGGEGRPAAAGAGAGAGVGQAEQRKEGDASSVLEADPQERADRLLEVRVTQMLKKIARGRTTNLAVLDLPMLDVLLPNVLPPHWRGKVQVEWDPSATIEGQPGMQWMRQLWEYIGEVSKADPEGGSLEAIREWPVVPTADGKLRQLFQPGGCLLLGAPWWTERLVSAFSRLGVHVLRDDISIPVAAHRGPAPQGVVTGAGRGTGAPLLHDPTAGGALDAILSSSASASGPLGTPLASPEPAAHRLPQPPIPGAGVGPEPLGTDGVPLARLYALCEGLTEGERLELRSFLCQSKWFTPGAPRAGSSPLLSDAQIRTLKGLPVFQSYGKAPGGSRVFVDLLRAPRFFAPSGIPEGLLGDQFLVVDSDAERKLLGSFLGVGQLELAAFFRGHVFPRVKEGGCDPEVVASAFLDLLLHRLPEMEGADRGFGEALSDIPFVPTRSGELKAPSRLYDPRVPQLFGLLDEDTFFPSGAYTAPEALEALLSLGMQRALSRRALVDSARSVEAAFADQAAAPRSIRGTTTGQAAGPAPSSRQSSAVAPGAKGLGGTGAAHAAGGASGGSGFVGGTKGERDALLPHQREALHRAHSLLLHLDERQLAKENWSSLEKGGGGVLPSEVQGPTQGVPLHEGPSLGASGEDGHAEDIPEERLWDELREIAWCPVLSLDKWHRTRGSEAEGGGHSGSFLEGATGGGEGGAYGMGLRLSPPWMEDPGHVAPARLVRPRNDVWLVSAHFRVLDGDLKSSSLRANLGWGDAPSAPVLARQLVSLARMYSQLLRTHGAPPAIEELPQEPSGAPPPSLPSSSAATGQTLGPGASEAFPSDSEGGRGGGASEAALGTPAGGASGTPAAGTGGSHAPQGVSPVRQQHPVAQLRGVLSEELPRVYRLLESYTAQPQAMETVKRTLQGAEWVWVGDAFVAPQALAFDSPAHFPPYLYVVPSSVAQFRRLLTSLGVRETLGAEEYAVVLARMRADAGGQALPEDQLQFCLRVLEAVAELAASQGRQPGDSPLLGGSMLVPDSQGVLFPARSLVFNDAAWLAGAMGMPAADGGQGQGAHPRLVHPKVTNEMAEVLGAKSLRQQSLVDQETTNTLPCLPAEVISELLDSWGDSWRLLAFDLMEVADMCGAKRMDVLWDKRQHPSLSLLQPNLAQFQGPALTVVLHGVSLTAEEVCQLQAPPPMKLRDTPCRYGTGLLGAYRLTDLLFVASSGQLFLFDPSGRHLAPGGGGAAGGGFRGGGAAAPTAKAFKLRGTDLPIRFADQFSPFVVSPALGSPSRSLSGPSSSSSPAPTWDNSTIIRIPLHRGGAPGARQGTGVGAGGGAGRGGGSGNGVGRGEAAWQVREMLRALERDAESSMVFLTSVEKVTCSVWEAGHGSGEKAGGPQELLMVMADPSTGSQRTPFVDVKWRKFQLSNWLSGGSAAHHPGTTKLCAIDVLVKTSPDIAKVLYPGPAPSVGAGTGTGCPVAGGTPEAASAAADSQQGTSVSESRGGGFVFTGSAGDFAVEGEGEGEGGKKGEGAKGGRGGSGSQAQGHVAINKWLVAQTLGAGRTRDMALDRKYLSLNLTPLAGTAARVFSNGKFLPPPASLGCATAPVPDAGEGGNTPGTPFHSPIHAPLPLSAACGLPVAVSGQFLVFRHSTRHLFYHARNPPNPTQTGEPGTPQADPLQQPQPLSHTGAPQQQLQTLGHLWTTWNRELLSCVRESYSELLASVAKLHLQELARAPVPVPVPQVGAAGAASGVPGAHPSGSAVDSFYALWPKSRTLAAPRRYTAHRTGGGARASAGAGGAADGTESGERGGDGMVSETGDPAPAPARLEAEVEEIGRGEAETLRKWLVTPLYARLADLPLWALHGGGMARVGEGMFLAPSGGVAGGGGPTRDPPESVGSFLRSQYQVFNVPWELVQELRHAGVQPQEVAPAMVRSLLRNPKPATAGIPVEAQVDLLEYCCTDVRRDPEPAAEAQGDISEALGEALEGPLGAAIRGGGASHSDRGLGSLAGLVPLPRESALRGGRNGPGGGVGGPPGVAQGGSGAREGRASGGGAPLTLQGLRGAVQGLTGDRRGGGNRGGGGGYLGGTSGASQDGVQSDADALVAFVNQLGRTALELGAQALAESPLGVPGPHQAPAAPAPPPPPLRVNETVVGELRDVVAPSAAERVVRLSRTSLIIAEPLHAKLFAPMAFRLLHPLCLSRPCLGFALGEPQFRDALSLHPFNPRHTAEGLQGVFSRNQVQVAAEMGWVSWEAQAQATEAIEGDRERRGSGLGYSSGPAQLGSVHLAHQWVADFWGLDEAALDASSNWQAIANYPLIPAAINEPVLVRVSCRHTVFVPPDAGEPPQDAVAQAGAPEAAPGVPALGLSSVGGGVRSAASTHRGAGESEGLLGQEETEDTEEVPPAAGSASRGQGGVSAGGPLGPGEPVQLFVPSSSSSSSSSSGASPADPAAEAQRGRVQWRFTALQRAHPWLLPLLQHAFGVPVFDQRFAGCLAAVKCCEQGGGVSEDQGASDGASQAQAQKSLPQLVLSKMLALRAMGRPVMRNLGTSLTHDQAQQLTAFFASHLHAPGAPRTNLGFLQQAMGGIQPGVYSDAELALLRSIPMFLTTSGELTSIDTSVHSVVSPTAFIQPQSDTCLKFQEDPAAKRFLQALGVPELSDSEVMAKFALPGFETKDPREQERILNHLLANWHRMKSDEAIVSALKQTKFVIPGATPSLAPLLGGGPARGMPAASGSGQPLALLPVGGVPPSLMDADTVSHGHPAHGNSQEQGQGARGGAPDSEALQGGMLRVCPNELLDPDVSLLRKVFAGCPEKFPGGQFASPRWLALLRDVGLRSVLTGEVLLECAQRVESLFTSRSPGRAGGAPSAGGAYAYAPGGGAGSGAGSSAGAAGDAGLTRGFMFAEGEEGQGETEFEDIDLFDALRGLPHAPGVGAPGAGPSGQRGQSGAGGRAVYPGPTGVVDEHLWGISVLVAETVMQNLNAVFGSRFAEPLSHTRFVPAVLGIPGASDAAGAGGSGGAHSSVARRVLTCYSEAVALKDWPLAWTVSPILARDSVVPPEFAWGQLHLKSPPPPATVLAHLKTVGQAGGEETLARWPNAVGSVSVESAFETIFRYLSRSWPSLSPADQESLKSMALVPVANATRLVPATSLFARMPEALDLAPFLFQLPSPFLPHASLLADLGMADHPSPPLLHTFLTALQRTCGYQRLNPNELRCVLQIVAYISQGQDASREASSGDAVVVDDHARLVAARMCVALDDAARHLLDAINPAAVRFVHPAVPPNLALGLGVKKLSEVVQEEIVEGGGEAVASIDNFTLAAVQERLRSPDFASAVWSIVREHSHALPKGLTRKAVTAALSEAAGRLRFASRVSTRYVLLPRRIDITRKTTPGGGASPSAPGTPSGGAMGTPADPGQKAFFVDTTTKRIVVGRLPTGVSFPATLGAALSRVLGSSVCLPLGPVIEAPQGKALEVTQALALGAPPGMLEEEEEERGEGGGAGVGPGVGGGGRRDGGLGGARREEPSVWQQRAAAARRGQPGERVLPSDASQLQCMPLRPFHRDEVVAWRQPKESPAPLRPMALAPPPWDSTRASPGASHAPGAPSGLAQVYSDTRGGYNDGGEGEAVGGGSGSAPSQLRYGRVVEDVRPTAGQALCRVKVETAPGETRFLLSSSILSFKSSSLSDSNLHVPEETGDANTAINSTSSSSSNSNQSGAEPPRSGSSAVTSSTSSRGGGAGAAAGEVSAAEVATAVRDMLAAAGIPLGAERGELLQKLLATKEQLKAADVALLEEQRRVEAASKEAESVRANWTCRICLTNEVDVTLSPCGHVLCQGCTASQRRCPFCRSHVQSILKMFRP